MNKYKGFLKALEGPFEDFVKSDLVNEYLQTIGPAVEDEVIQDGIPHAFMIVSGYEADRGKWGTIYESIIRFGSTSYLIKKEEGISGDPIIITPNFIRGKNRSEDELEYRMGLIKIQDKVLILPVILRKLHSTNSFEVAILENLCVIQKGIVIDQESGQKLGQVEIQKITAYQQFLAVFWNIDDYLRKQNPEFYSDFDIDIWRAIEAFSGRIVSQLIDKILNNYRNNPSWVISDIEEICSQNLINSIEQCIANQQIINPSQIEILVKNLCTYMVKFKNFKPLQELSNKNINIKSYLFSNLNQTDEPEAVEEATRVLEATPHYVQEFLGEIVDEIEQLISKNPSSDKVTPLAEKLCMYMKLFNNYCAIGELEKRNINILPYVNLTNDAIVTAVKKIAPELYTPYWKKLVENVEHALHESHKDEDQLIPIAIKELCSYMVWFENYEPLKELERKHINILPYVELDEEIFEGAQKVVPNLETEYWQTLISKIEQELAKSKPNEKEIRTLMKTLSEYIIKSHNSQPITQLAKENINILYYIDIFQDQAQQAHYQKGILPGPEFKILKMVRQIAPQLELEYWRKLIQEIKRSLKEDNKQVNSLIVKLYSYMYISKNYTSVEYLAKDNINILEYIDTKLEDNFWTENNVIKVFNIIRKRFPDLETDYWRSLTKKIEKILSKETDSPIDGDLIKSLLNKLWSFIVIFKNFQPLEALGTRGCDITPYMDYDATAMETFQNTSRFNSNYHIEELRFPIARYVSGMYNFEGTCWLTEPAEAECEILNHFRKYLIQIGKIKDEQNIYTRKQTRQRIIRSHDSSHISDDIPKELEAYQNIIDELQEKLSGASEIDENEVKLLVSKLCSGKIKYHYPIVKLAVNGINILKYLPEESREGDFYKILRSIYEQVEELKLNGWEILPILLKGLFISKTDLWASRSILEYFLKYGSLKQSHIKKLVDAFSNQNSSIQQASIFVFDIVLRTHPDVITQNEFSEYIKKKDRSCGLVDCINFFKVQSFESLIKCLSNQNPRVREWTIEYLGKFGDPRAAEHLAKCIEEKAVSYDHKAINHAVIEALGNLKCVDLLFEQMKHLDLRSEILYQLGRIGGKKVIDFLISYLKKDESNLQEAARNGLAELGVSGVPQLLLCLNDSNPSVQSASLKIIYDLLLTSDFDDAVLLNTVPQLLLCLNDSNPSIQGVSLKIIYDLLLASDFDGAVLLNAIKTYSRSPLNPEKALLQFLSARLKGSDYVRGNTLWVLFNFFRTKMGWDKEIFESLTALWADKAIWVREIVNQVFYQLGLNSPKDSFELTSDFLLKNFDTLKLDDLYSGISEGAYAVRYLFQLYQNYGFEEEFQNFLQQLKSMYPNNEKKVTTILEFISSYVDLDLSDWNTIKQPLKTVDSRCWTCKHWQWQQLPKFHWKFYLTSEAYKDWNYKGEWMRVEEHLDENGQVVPWPFEAMTGRFLLDDDDSWIRLEGYCIKQHKMMNARASCGLYNLRELELPFVPTVVALSTYESFYAYLLTKLDSTMRCILNDFISGCDWEHYPGDVEFFLTEAVSSMSIYYDRSEDHEMEACTTHFSEIICGRAVYEESSKGTLMKFPVELHFLCKSDTSYDKTITLSDFESILTSIICRIELVKWISSR